MSKRQIALRLTLSELTAFKELKKNRDELDLLSQELGNEVAKRINKPEKLFNLNLVTGEITLIEEQQSSDNTGGSINPG